MSQEQDVAATKIQAAFRGFRERARLDAMIDAMEAELEREMSGKVQVGKSQGKAGALRGARATR